MPQSPPQIPADPVVLTTSSRLRALIAEEVERGCKRVLGDTLSREPEPEWIPLGQAAKAYGKSRSTIFRWRRDGRIETKEIGGSVYVRRP